MSSSKYILDVDTSFMDRLAKLDSYLDKDIKGAKQLTNAITTMGVNMKGGEKSVRALVEALQGLRGTSPFLKISEDGKLAIDTLNLARANINTIRDTWKEFTGSLNKQQHKSLYIKNDKDLQDLQKVQEAIRSINKELSAGTNKKGNKLSQEAINRLQGEKEILSKVAKELKKTDSRRVMDFKTGAEKAVKDVVAALDKEQKAREAVTKATIAQEEAERKRTKKENITPTEALLGADKAKNIRDLETSLKELKEASKNVNIDTKSGRNQFNLLNNKIKETKDKLKEIYKEQDNVRSGFSGISNSADRMRGAVSAALSIAAIKGYAENVVKVYGAFEMTRKSLSVLLKTEERALMMFNKISRLAVKSPFTIQQLTDATRQMAAYRIESGKLYEKTKMLADISAGLGVEMNRLILAYGQVKAANFLRATELRQFSEAGIDMLGQLSAYYSELEGKVVSTAEVFDRISKRQVLFEDVDEVLTRVTSKGGTFYKMQEEQAKTVAGRISNIKDEIQLAFDEIGKSSHDAILNVLGMIKAIVKNLHEIVRFVIPFAHLWISVTAGAAVFKTLRSAIKGVEGAWENMGKALKAIREGFTRATPPAKAFGNVIRSLPSIMGGLVGVATMLIPLFIDFGESAEEASGYTKELADKTENLHKSASDLADVYDEESKKMAGYMSTIIDTTKAIDDLNKVEDKNAAQQTEMTRLIGQRKTALAELAGLSAEFAQQVATVLAGGSPADVENVINGIKARINDRIQVMNNFASLFASKNAEENTKFFDAHADRKVSGLISSMQSSEIDEQVKDLPAIKKLSGMAEEEANKILLSIKSLDNELEGLDFYDKTSNFVWNKVELPEKFHEYINKALELGVVSDTDKKLIEEALNRGGGYAGTYDEGTRVQDAFYNIIKNTERILERGITAVAAEQASVRLDAPPEEVQRWFAGVAEILKKEVSQEDLAKMNATPDSEEAKEVKYKIQSLLLNYIEELDSRENKETVARFVMKELGTHYEPLLTEPLQYWQRQYNAYLDENTPPLTSDMQKNLPYELTKISRANTERKTQAEGLKGIIDDYTKIIELYTRYGDKSIYSKEEYDRAKTFLPIAKNLHAYLTGPTKSDKEASDKVLKSITDVHKSFLDLRKDMEEPDAIAGSWDKYGDSLRIALEEFGLSLEDFRAMFGDLSSESSVNKALTWLRDQFVKGSDEYYKIQREIDERDQTDRVRNIQKKRETASLEIEEAFSGFELSMELEKLNVPKDFAQDFFGISLHDMPGIRDFIKARKDIFSGEEGKKEYLKFMARLDELEAKQQRDHLKKYLEYTKKAMGERAQILLKGYQELMEIEKAFQLTNTLAQKRGLITKEQKDALDAKGLSLASMTADELKGAGINLTNEQISGLLALRDSLSAQASAAKTESGKRIDKELNKMDWETLKSTDTFIQMFNDLESMSEASLRNMIATLNEYKQQWTDMPVSDVKEMINKINELEMALISLQKPKESRAAIRKAMGEIKGITSKENAQATQLAAEEEILRLEKEKSLVEEIEALKQKGLDEEALKQALSNRGVVLADEQKRILEAQSSSYDSQISDEREKVNNATKYLSLLKLLLKTYDEQADRINKTKKLTDKLFDGWDAINSLFEDDALTNGLSELSRGVTDNVFAAIDFANQFKKAKEAIDTASDAAEIFGLQMNAAMGVIGLIVTAVQIFAKVMKFAIEQHDAALQSRIDNELKNIKELQRSYEALEKAIERAYTTAELGSKSRDAISNLEDQKRATEQMISLEEQKKKSDQDTIDEWKDNIADMEAQIEELKENTFSKLTDGILDDVLSVTRSFVDAWYDAFKEAGSGMKGLEESFNEMLLNMLKQQASMQLITPYLNKWKEWLKMYVNADDAELTKEEAKAWAEKVKGTLPEINNLLEGFFDGVDSILATGGELSDLEKGIQGMTEDQAEVLAAYWNSCRFMLSNIDTTLATLAKSSLQSVDDSNPIIAELRAQTKVMTDIKNILSSVIGFGSSIPSSYIRVLA